MNYIFIKKNSYYLLNTYKAKQENLFVEGLWEDNNDVDVEICNGVCDVVCNGVCDVVCNVICDNVCDVVCNGVCDVVCNGVCGVVDGVKKKIGIIIIFNICWVVCKHILKWRKKSIV